ncbi:MAG: hypothetical protein ABI151_08330 [Chitinophagaceae bacterium]
MNSVELQVAFFNRIKENMPGHLSFVDEVAEKLHISTDSAYRRIRGEKPLTLEEAGILSVEFKVSLDQFFSQDPVSGSLLFSAKYIDRDNEDIEGYLKGLHNQLEYFNSFAEKEITYINKDLPIFYCFMFPELASFKYYFWSRYNLNYSDFRKASYSAKEESNIIPIRLGKQISDSYINIPSTEVWNLDSVSLSLYQLEYCRQSKIFASEQDVLDIYNGLHKLIDHIEDQVDAGVKFLPGKKPHSGSAKYKVFINEFVAGDNTVIVQLDNKKIVSLNHNTLNYMTTSNERFVEYTCQTVQNLLRKSALISETGEKERHLFFNKLRWRINQSMNS